MKWTLLLRSQCFNINFKGLNISNAGDSDKSDIDYDQWDTDLL